MKEYKLVTNHTAGAIERINELAAEGYIVEFVTSCASYTRWTMAREVPNAAPVKHT